MTNPARTREDVGLLTELLPVVKSILKTHDSLRWLLSVDGFVYTLLLCLLLKQPNMVVDLLTFLGIICGTSEGEQQVLDAFDRLMLFDEEKTRFQSVVALLSTTDDAEVALNVLVFFNNMLHHSQSIVQRMAVRSLLLLHSRSSPTFSRWTTNPWRPSSSRASLGRRRRSPTSTTCSTYATATTAAATLSGVDTSDVVSMVRACVPLL